MTSVILFTYGRVSVVFNDPVFSFSAGGSSVSIKNDIDFFVGEPSCALFLFASSTSVLHYGQIRFGGSFRKWSFVDFEAVSFSMSNWVRCFVCVTHFSIWKQRKNCFRSNGDIYLV